GGIAPHRQAHGAGLRSDAVLRPARASADLGGTVSLIPKAAQGGLFLGGPCGHEGALGLDRPQAATHRGPAICRVDVDAHYFRDLAGAGSSLPKSDELRIVVPTGW